MAGISHELEILAVGMAMTVVLLMLGASVGYWAGTRTLALSLPGDHRWHNEQSQILNQLAGCVKQSEQASEQSEALAALGRASADFLPAELTKAIDCLVDTTAGLANQLRSLHSSTFAKRQDNPKQIQPTGYLAATEQQPLKIADVAAASATCFTPEQMSDVMGGRKNLGESTFGLETKRYPYDCFQQMAPWHDAEPTPTLDQFSKVRCHEISVSGISFFWPQAPDFESVIISIGTGDKLIFMQAQVCTHKAVFKHNEVSFLIDCRYLRRMEGLTTQWQAADELIGVA